MRLPRRCFCFALPRACCSWRTLTALVTLIYTMAFLYSVTSSHYRVLYLSPKEIYADTHANRLSRSKADAVVSNQGGAARLRRLLQNGNGARSEDVLKGLDQKPQTDNRPLCEPPLSELGYVRVNPFLELNLTGVMLENPAVQKGGWKPSNCRSVQKVAILIPHRDRHHHLALLLRRLHPLMQLQQLEYQVFVIEQLAPEEFNRGMLLNVGFLEALAVDPSFDCFIFQDVDLIPEHFQNLYMCTNQIHHLASAIDEMRFHVMFYNYAGGVVAVNKRNFLKVNGYANNYWGWGNEDDDFSARTLESGMLLTRPLERIGRYKMVKHKKAARSDSGNSLFMSWRKRWESDGVKNLAELKPYEVQSVDYSNLYVNISVSLDRKRTAQLLHGFDESPDNSSKTSNYLKFWDYVQNTLFFLRFYFP